MLVSKPRWKVLTLGRISWLCWWWACGGKSALEELVGSMRWVYQKVCRQICMDRDWVRRSLESWLQRFKLTFQWLILRIIWQKLSSVLLAISVGLMGSGTLWGVCPASVGCCCLPLNVFLHLRESLELYFPGSFPVWPQVRFCSTVGVIGDISLLFVAPEIDAWQVAHSRVPEAPCFPVLKTFLIWGYSFLIWVVTNTGLFGHFKFWWSQGLSGHLCGLGVMIWD